MAAAEVITIRRGDPVRPGQRLRCRVFVNPASTSIPGMPKPARHGESEVIIHEDDLPALQAKVEPEMDLLPRCEKSFLRKRNAWMAQALRIKAEEIQDDETLWTQDKRDMAFRYTETSIPGEFTLLTGRCINPLRYVEVLETLPGEVPDDVRMAAQIAKAFGGGTPQHSDATTSEVTKALAAMAAKVEELEAELSRRRGGRPRRQKPGA